MNAPLQYLISPDEPRLRTATPSGDESKDGDASNEVAPSSVPSFVEPVPDTKAAVDYLLARPGFPVLSFNQIDPVTGKKGLFETRSFPDRERGPLEEWLDRRQGRGNLYYSINPAIAPQNEKLERKGIKDVVSLHIDLDPRINELQEAAQARLIGQLNKLEKPPTWTIVSGGGVQGIWDLKEPIAIDGNIEKAEEAKLYNVKLEQELGGDHCHNIDRIMRIPGTINCPDERKIKKGRKRALAYVVKHDASAVYPINDFEKAKPLAAAPTVAKTATTPTSIAPSSVSAGPRIQNIDDHPTLKLLKNTTKRAVLFGYDPENMKTWASRSEMVFGFACEAARLGVPHEDTASVLTDLSFKISESILEKKNVQREVDRVIARATLYTNDPELFEMNERFAVVKVKGKTLIVSFEENASGYLEPVYQSFDSFIQFHSKFPREYPVKVGDDTKTKTTTRGDFWLYRSKGQRTQYEGIKYIPHNDERVVGGYLNLWKGFSVEAVNGDKHLGFIGHIRDNLCKGVTEYSDYFINRMAYIAQTRKRSGVVQFLRSVEEGTGKTFYSEHYGHLYGAHARKVSREEHLAGKFNAHLQSCSYICAEELSITADGKLDGAFKDLATSETLTVEPKTVDAFQVPNFLNIDVTSNHLQVITASQTARRYFVLNVGTERKNDFDYFDKIAADLKSGGYENLLYFLLNRDLSDFNVRKVPQTDALAEQKAQSRNGVDALIEHICNVGQVPCSSYEHPAVANTYGTRNGDGFWAWAKHNQPDLRDHAPQVISTALKKWGCKGVDSGGRTGVRFPALSDLRKLFEHHHGAQQWTINSRSEWLRPPQDPNNKESRR